VAEQAVQENVAKGELGIEIKQKDATQADQVRPPLIAPRNSTALTEMSVLVCLCKTWRAVQSWASKGVYSNLFYNHLAIFNPLEKEVAIVKVKSEYEKNGEWIEMNTRYPPPLLAISHQV
jgi:hypothetical protein